MGICYNVMGICRNSTINKLIVIRVCFYQVKSIIWSYIFNKWGIYNGLNNYICCFLICQLLKYLHILFNNFVRHT